jgi:hypothetical protein
MGVDPYSTLELIRRLTMQVTYIQQSYANALTSMHFRQANFSIYKQDLSHD